MALIDSMTFDDLLRFEDEHSALIGPSAGADLTPKGARKPRQQATRSVLEPGIPKTGTAHRAKIASRKLRKK
jgi:hypothetical protein